jgi:hypothetical protein
MYLQKRTFHASMSRKHPHTLLFTIEMVSMRQAAAWTASNLRHPPFEWSVSLPRIFVMQNAHVRQNMATSQLRPCPSWIEHVILRMTFILKAHIYDKWATRRKDGIYWIDHSINPHISVMQQSTCIKHVASSSLVVQVMSGTTIRVPW